MGLPPKGYTRSVHKDSPRVKDVEGETVDRKLVTGDLRLETARAFSPTSVARSAARSLSEKRFIILRLRGDVSCVAQRTFSIRGIRLAFGIAASIIPSRRSAVVAICLVDG
jgi:hypothetical protein